ncbi:MAG TPA: histidine--tRNA ligase [bacterium]|nr:histidine--tRNA ligase [bacterium]
MDVKAPRGMQDVLPGETARWQHVEGVLRDIARRYGYREIRTPVVEHTEVFQRGVGAGTDIVEKEMYTFLDRGGRSLSLRAEGTAPVMRAFLEHNLGAGGLPVRVYYICPIFRYDRPQAGRYRQHTQFGAEIIGSAEPAADAEVLSLAVRGLETLGLTDVALHLNSVGDPVCRPRYLEALRHYFRPHLEELCEDCRRRFEIAPLRLLDCKKEHDRRIAAGAPRMLDYLCDACRAHFDGVQAHLGAMGITYRVDPGIVRGLDYYTRTAAEVFSGKIGAQNAMFGGGRYDGLAEQLGGRPSPGVGFGMGVERVLLVLEQEGVGVPVDAAPDLFIATGASEDPARALSVAAHALADRLRRAGLVADADAMGRSLTAQMRHANRVGARFVLILDGTRLPLRDMGTKEEVALAADPAEAGAVAHGDEAAMERIVRAVTARVGPRAAGKERG